MNTDTITIISNGSPVVSVNRRIGAVTLSANDVGLGNVDNTSDLNKPLSYATLSAFEIIQTEINSLSSNGGGNSIYEAGSGCYSIQPINGNNTASGYGSTISGGVNNCIITTDSNYSGYCGISNIAGGWCNTITGSCLYTGNNINGGSCNTVSAIYGGSIVGGGAYNTASGGYSVVTGGYYNNASGFNSNVAGGFYNTASGRRSNVAGGSYNIASGCYSTVSGGINNTASGYYSAILNGSSNTTSGYYSVILGGYNNNDNGHDNVIILGSTIKATAANTTYVNNLSSQGIIYAGCFCGCGSGGGNSIYEAGSGCNSIQPIVGSNIASGCYSSILGGHNNCNCNNNSFVIGSNITTSADCTTFVNNICTTNSIYSSSLIGSGSEVILSDGTNCSGNGNGSLSLNFSCGVYVSNDFYVSGCIYGCGISGVLVPSLSGCTGSIQPSFGNNTSSGNYSSVLGGKFNCVNTSNSVVVGGVNNNACSTMGWSAVVGGGFNTASAEYDTFVGGGWCNTACGNGSAIVGGCNNTASGVYSFIGGGQSNVVSGDCSAILGGCNNNDCGFCNVFILGSNLSANQANTTYVNSININGGCLSSADGISLCWNGVQIN